MYKKLIVLALTILPSLALAQDRVTFGNPLVFPNVQSLVSALVQVLIVLLIPVVVFFVIFAGFKYVTAQGNPSKIEEANKSLMYALVGAVIIVGAFAITQIVQNTVDQFRPQASLQEVQLVQPVT